ncbi:hypothetical protein ACSBR1_029975 [Camellia fascicularis]
MMRLAVAASSLESFSWISSWVPWTASDSDPTARFFAPTTSFSISSAPENNWPKRHYTEGAG